MNTYQTSQSLGITGDDATQHATLQAYGMTRSRIAIADLLFLLSDRNMMVRLIRPADTGEKWSGSIINLILYVNENGTADQITGVNKFFSHITNDRNTWFDTTNPAYSSPLQAMRAMFADQPGMPSSADFDAFVSLGGGYLCGTLEEFAAEHEAADTFAAEQAAIAIKDSALNRVRGTASEAAAEEYRKADSTAASIIAAAVAVLTGA